jgi:hypothetical protein
MGTLASLIAGLASGETVAAVRRARLAVIAYALASVAALCGLAFLVGAGYIWVARLYGFVTAAVCFGAGFLVLSGLIVLIFKLGAGSRRERQVKRRKTDMTAVGVTAALAVLPTLLRGKGGLGALLMPAIAAAAYAIYRENAKTDGDSGPDSAK